MKILVVEDDKTVGEYVRRGLDEAGYHVDLVGDGDEGLGRAGRSGDGPGPRHDHERASAEGEAGTDLDPRPLGLSLAAHQAGSDHGGPLAPFTYESVASELSECFESCVV